MPAFPHLFCCTSRHYWSKSKPSRLLLSHSAPVGRNETTKTHERQLQFLVYHLEAASLMADQHGVGKMMWLVDFVGYSFMTAPPVKIAIQTVHILQVILNVKLVPGAKPSGLCFVMPHLNIYEVGSEGTEVKINVCASAESLP